MYRRSVLIAIPLVALLVVGLSLKLEFYDAAGRYAAG
jgi:hypothetical protein